MNHFVRNMHALFRLTFVSVLALGSLSVVAETGQNEWLLAKYDLNGDALISQDEIALKKKNIFLQLDMDRDGAVSFEEYQEMDLNRRRVLLKARFGKLDLDRDGLLDEQEYSAYMGSFKSIDTDGDGMLSPKEVSSSKERSNSDGTLKTKDDNTYCLFWVCLRTRLD